MKRQSPLSKMEATPTTSVESITLTKGTVPVPTDLLDRIMPTLRDTELRVLLVVVRQTLGWQIGKDPYLRKERDWLTQSQLMRRAGRASGAIARAVDTLVQKNLIEVLDKEERLLNTPAERRRCLGRLYYRLHKAGKAIVSEKAPSRSIKSEHAKAHTTRNTLYNNKQKPQRAVDKAVENPLIIRSSGWTRAGYVNAAQRRCEAITESQLIKTARQKE